MNSTSSVITGAAMSAGVAIAPLVDWILNTLLHWAAPQQVVLIISGGLVTGGHFVVNRVNARSNLGGVQ
jgi:hypothetical protein